MNAAERETVIQMDDESDLVHIWSAQRTQITKMRSNDAFTEKASGKHDGTEWASFTIRRDRWSVTGVKRNRVMTPEQRKAAGERLRRARESA